MMFEARLPLAILLAAILCSAACKTTSEVGPTKLGGDAITTTIYPVKDLVFSRAPVDASGRGEPEGAWIQIADLIANIKNATNPNYWETEGTAIRAEDSGYLQVEATAAMQQQVAQVLADMRRFASKQDRAQ